MFKIKLVFVCVKVNCLFEGDFECEKRKLKLNIKFLILFFLYFLDFVMYRKNERCFYLFVICVIIKIIKIFIIIFLSWYLKVCC